MAVSRICARVRRDFGVIFERAVFAGAAMAGAASRPCGMVTTKTLFHETDMQSA
jgi:hypothetical protein